MDKEIKISMFIIALLHVLTWVLFPQEFLLFYCIVVVVLGSAALLGYVVTYIMVWYKHNSR